mmetsp:Transcript_40523/g.118748  ORF Transcript_40523/g.118748 Transcript_40523/m.118748 type:complete len:111 (-) Transcript_40523:134-466(-)
MPASWSLVHCHCSTSRNASASAAVVDAVEIASTRLSEDERPDKGNGEGPGALLLCSHLCRAASAARAKSGQSRALGASGLVDETMPGVREDHRTRGSASSGPARACCLRI